MLEARLAKVRVVLVRTTHPGNIGAAARAMRTMGLADLALVRPARFPAREAVAMASGAVDLLDAARVYPDLERAIADCRRVLAASARPRGIPWPTCGPREAAAQLLEAAAGGPVALVLGPERTGLTNEEIDLCQGVVQIPTVPSYRSLNVAAALQVLAWELRAAAIGAAPPPAETAAVPLASAAALERLYRHIEETMVDVGFLDPDKPRRLPRRLRRLLARAALDEDEVQILRGFLAAVQERIRGR